MATTKRTKPVKKVARSRAATIRKRRVSRALHTDPRSIALAVGAALLPWGSAYALPTGENVVAGSVTVTRPSSQFMQINQGTQKGIVNWTSFSIGASEHVNVTQLNASSVLLNRVVGNDPSQIFGRLTANGQIFLVNTAGVLFAPSASVEVGALLATSLSINDQDFLAGRYLFSREGNAGSVINQGNILTPTGYTALVGPQVRNDGVIVARAGSVVLAGADRVSLDMIGDGLISISVDQAALNASVINTGRIEADGGTVLLTARSANALLDTVINTSGLIRANSLVERNGEIVLDGGGAGVVAVSGTLKAAGVDAGTTGGTIKVLGDKVALLGHANVSASGDAGGGTVLIGGNFQGKGPEANASQTFVGANTSVSADAVTAGDGGKVIVWADGTTRFHGTITARGGAQSGNGGFVEVSGKQHLAFDGRVDVRAPAGSAGTILLDPDNITIVANGGGADDTEVTDNNSILFGDRPTESLTISETAIEGLTGNIVLQAEVDITVDVGLTGGLQLNVGATSLVLQAGNNISVGSAITTANPAGTAIHLEADSPHATGGANNAGTLTIAATGPVSSGNGAITLIAADFDIGAAVSAGSGAISVARSQDGATLTIGTGELTAAEINNLSTTGTLTLGQATTAGSNGLGGGTQLTAGSIVVDASTSVNGATAGHFRLIANDGVTLTESLTTNQQTTINADFDAGDDNGPLSVANGKTLSTTGNVLSVTANDLNLNALGTISSGVASSTLIDSDASGIGLGDTAATNGLNISGAELQRITATGLTLQTGGNITVDNITAANSNNITGVTTLTANGVASAVSFETGASTFNALRVNSTTDISIDAALTTDIGNLTLNAGGSVTQTAAITASGLELLGAGATFTLDTQNNDVTNLAGNTGTVSFRDDNGFTIATVNTAGLTTSGTTTLKSDGTVDQTAALSAPTLVLTATNAGSGDFTLTNASNALGTVSSSNTLNTVSLRDDAGFTLGTLTTDTSVTLQSNGTVDQVGVLTAPTLTMTASNAGSGDFTLNSQANVIGTADTTNTVNSVSLRDDTDLTLAAITTDTSVTLQSNGAVTQTAALTAPTLTLTATAAGSGDFTLTNASNALGTVSSSNTLNTVSLRDDAGFTLGTLTTDTSVTLQSNGTVDQVGVLTAPTLTMTASNAGSGDFTLNSQANVIGTADTTNTVNSVSLRDDTDLTLAAITTDTSVTLQSNGAVTQTAALTAPVLTLTATAAGSGDFTLTNASNVLGTVSSSNTVNSVSLRDDTDLTLGALAVDTSVVLQTDGTVTQVGALTGSPAVTLTATNAGSGDFTLTNASNALGTVSSSNTLNTVSLRDDAGFTLGTLTTDTSVTLQSNGTVDQVGVLTAPTLTMTASNAGSGDFTLNSQANVIGTADTTNTVNSVSLRDDTDLTLGALAVDTSVVLQTDGTVTQVGALTGSPAVTLTASNAGSGDFTLTNASNALGTVSSSNTLNTVSLRDDAGFTLGTLTTDTSVTLQSNGTVDQVGVLTAPTLTMTASNAGSGDFTLNSQANVIGTADTTNTVNSVSLRDDTDLTLAAITTDTSVTLQSNGAVTQTAALTAPTLTLTATAAGSGDFTLTNASNALGTVSSSNTLNTVSLRDDAGFTLGTLTTDTSVTLQSNGTVDQVGVLTAPTLTMTASNAGSGDFTLNSQANVIGTADTTNTVNSVSLRDDTDLTLAALTTDTSVTLQSNGTVDQVGVLTAPTLTMTASNAGSGDFTLNSQANVIGTADTTNTVNSVSLRDDTDLTLGALAVDTSVVLQTDGTVTQVGALTGSPAVTLTASNAGSGDFTLTNASNALGTVSSSNTLNTVSLRDDAGFTLGTLTTDTSVTLQSNGTVDQVGVLTAPTLTMTASNAGSGDFTLNSQANVIGTADTTNTVNSVSLRDDAGFTLGTLTTDTSVTLQSNGTVDQVGVLTAPTLTLTATAAGSGDFTLTNASNALGTVSSSNTLNTVSLRDDAGFTLGTLTTDTSVTLQSNGTVDQVGVLTAPTLTMTASNAGSGDFTLNSQANVIGTADTTNTVNSVSLRDDTDLTLAAITTDTSVTLQSNGAVTQTAALTAPVLTLTATAAGSGDFTLTNASNVLGTVSSSNTVNSVSLRDDTDLTLGALAVDTSVVLQTDGTVTQVGALTGSPAVTLTASNAGSGDFTLTNASNALGTVSSSNTVNTVSLRDDAGFTLGTLTTDTSVTLQSNGTVDQVGVLTAPTLTMTASNAGSGDFTLNSQANVIGTADTTNTVNSVSLRDDTDLTLAAITTDTSVTLQSNGAVTQTAALTAPVLTLTATAAGSGDFTLTNASNALGTVSSSNTLNTVSLRDDAGFTLGTLTTDTSVTLQSNGTVDQVGVLTAPTLTMTASNAGSGDFTLNSQANVIGTADTTNTVNSVSLRDDAGFMLAAITTDTSVTLQSSGSVTQTAVLTAPTLTVQGTGGTFNLGTQNNAITTLDADNSALTALSFRDDGGFGVAGINATGNVTLSTTGTVTQSGVINAAGLELLGASGTFTLNTQTNTITTLAGNTGTVSLLDAGGIAFGTVGTAGLTTTGNLNLATTGAVTQSQALTISGTASIDAGAGAITLTSGNDFQAAVTVATTGGATQVTDINNITFTSPLNLGGSFTVTANAGAGTITLGDVTTTGLQQYNGNVFMSSNYVTNGGAFNITGTTTVGSNSTITSGAGNVTLSGAVNSELAENNTLTINSSGATTLSSAAGTGQALGALTTDALGTTSVQSVTTTGAQTYGDNTTLNGTYNTTNSLFSVAGTTTLAGGTTINSGNGGATFTNSVTGAQALTVNTSGTTAFGSTVNIASLSTDAGGSTTLANNVTTTGNQTYGDAVSAGTVTLTGATITATNAGNDFTGTLSVSGASASITDVNGLSINANLTGGLTTNSVALSYVSGTSVGSLNSTASGAVTETGPITVTGTTSINAGANSITLTAANQFGGAVSLTGGTTQITDVDTLTLGNLNTSALTVINNGALDLGTGTVSGALSANSGNGNISQTGALVVAGTTTLQAGTGSISLAASNDFQNSVTATGFGGISLVDANTLDLSAINAGAGVVNLTGNALTGLGAVDGGSGTFSSNVNVVGLVTHMAGQLTVTGNATIWNFGTGSTANPFAVTSQNIGVLVDGAVQVANLVQQQTAAVIGSVAEQIGAIVSEEANKTFGTDSVAEDVEFGFAGEIGATPPMDHRIDESGISLPRCVQEAREGLPCK